MARVKEYRRECRQCGQVWHSLMKREAELARKESDSKTDVCCNCCDPNAQLQAKRNRDATQSELTRLKMCPKCQSSNYKETIV
jgi:hypothetical protein